MGAGGRGALAADDRPPAGRRAPCGSCTGACTRSPIGGWSAPRCTTPAALAIGAQSAISHGDAAGAWRMRSVRDRPRPPDPARGKRPDRRRGIVLHRAPLLARRCGATRRAAHHQPRPHPPRRGGNPRATRPRACARRGALPRAGLAVIARRNAGAQRRPPRGTCAARDPGRPRTGLDPHGERVGGNLRTRLPRPWPLRLSLPGPAPAVPSRPAVRAPAPDRRDRWAGPSNQAPTGRRRRLGTPPWPAGGSTRSASPIEDIDADVERRCGEGRPRAQRGVVPTIRGNQRPSRGFAATGRSKLNVCPRYATDRRPTMPSLPRPRLRRGARVGADARPATPRRSPASRPSSTPACAGTTSSGPARSTAPGWRSTSTSTPSTTRTWPRATSGRRSTSTTTTCSSSCTSRCSTSRSGA